MQRYRTSLRSTRLAATLAAAVSTLALVLAACSGAGAEGRGAGESGPAAKATVLRAVAKTVDAHSATFDYQGHGHLGAVGDIGLAASGRYDFRHNVGDFHVVADEDGKQTTVDFRSDHHHVWFKSPALDDTLHGKSWGQMSYREATRAGVIEASSNPFDVLLAFYGAEHVQPGGPIAEAGDGTAYHADIDLKAAHRQLSSAEDKRLDEAFHVDGTNELTGTVWLDGKHRVRRVQLEASGSSEMAGTIRFTVDAELHDLNATVHVDAPDGDSVGRITAGQLKRALGSVLN